MVDKNLCGMLFKHVVSYNDTGVGKGGPGPPWFLVIAGQSRPGLASLQQESFLQ